MGDRQENASKARSCPDAAPVADGSELPGRASMRSALHGLSRMRLLLLAPLVGAATALGLLGWGRHTALACDAWVLAAMLCHAASTLPARSRLRRLLMIAALDGHRLRDPVQAVTSEQSEARRTVRWAALAVGSSALAAMALTAAGRWGVVASAGLAFVWLWVSAKLPGLRERAGLGHLTRPGSAIRILADAAGVPHRWYSSAGGSVVPPLAFALALLAGCATAAATVVDVDGTTVSIGDAVLSIHRVGGTDDASGPGPVAGEHSTAAARPSSAPPPDRAMPEAAAEPAGQARPDCAEYEAISAGLREGPVPPAVAEDMEAAWRRVNWPTLGCVDGPPRVLGASWVAVLRDRQQGAAPSLLVHVAGSVRVVHASFGDPVLLIAPSLVDLGDPVSFGAGRFQIAHAADGSCRAVLTGERQAVLVLPPAVTVLSGRAAALGAFPWVSRADDAAREGTVVYTVRWLVPTAGYPGYVEQRRSSIAYDPSTAVAAADGVAVVGDEPCGATARLLADAASPVASSAARQVAPD